MTNDQNAPERNSMRDVLRALDPDLDPLAAGRFLTEVASRIEAGTRQAERARGLIPVDPLYGLWSLPRPLLLAASIIAFAIVGVVARAGATAREAPGTVAESIGVPSQLLASGALRP